MAASVKFGPFEYDRNRRELHKHGLRIRVPDQSLKVLSALLDHPGETVTRETIQQLLWPDGTTVSFEQSINAAVKGLRHALGDSADGARYVERVPREGYRFIAPVLTPEVPRRRASWPAVAGLLAVAVAVLWLWGRGPLAERDLVVIADIENKTSDAMLGGALGQALVTQVGEWPYLRIAGEDRIRRTLGYMGHEPDGGLGPDTAREVCRRLGAKAILAGTVGAAGKRYFVGLRALACSDGEVLASEYSEAESREALLPALGHVTRKMRRHLGRRLAAVRDSEGPAEATTGSLEALHAYSLALKAKAVGQDPVPFLEGALAMDAGFAMAHFTLAQVYRNRGQERGAEEAIARAFALRERASQRERLAIENYYHVVASGDLPKAIAAGILAGRLYPNDAASRRSVVFPYLLAGNAEEARRVALAELEFAPDQGVSYFNLAIADLSLGRTESARAALGRAAAQGIGYDLFPFARFGAAVLDGDRAGMQREQPIPALAVQAALYFGELRKARKLADGNAALLAAVALAEAVFGLPADARHDAGEALARDRGRRTVAPAALALALAGERERAARVIDELAARYPSDTLLREVWIPAVRGGAGNEERAWAGYVRGVSLGKAGRKQEAAAQFERLIAQRPALLMGAFAYGAGAAYPAALAGLGRVRGDRSAYAQLLALWDRADAEIPMLEEARREFAATGSETERRDSPASR